MTTLYLHLGVFGHCRNGAVVRLGLSKLPKLQKDSPQRHGHLGTYIHPKTQAQIGSNKAPQKAFRIQTTLHGGSKRIPRRLQKGSTKIPPQRHGHSEMTLNVMNPKSAPTRHPEMRSLGNFEMLKTTYQAGSNTPKHVMLKALQKHTKTNCGLAVWLFKHRLQPLL